MTQLHPGGHPSRTHRIPDRCSEGSCEHPVVICKALDIRYTRKSLHRCAVDRDSVNSTDRGKLDAYNKHRVGDLVFAHSTSENYHPGFSGRARELVQITDVLYDIDYETRRPERVEI